MPTGCYRRHMKFNYTEADQMFLEGKTLREISHKTGISWSTLYSHFYTNVWRRAKDTRELVPRIDPSPLNYREKLQHALSALSAKYGITDWSSPKGQKILEQFALRTPGRRENGHDDTIYALGIE